ncbi:MAG: lysophospholipid acyltransferase family protein [Anditalea sp.]
MFAFRIISYLPLSILYLFSDFLYLIACYILRYREKVIDANLLHAFPEKSPSERKKIKKQFYRNFTDSLAETVKLLTISQGDLAKRVKIENVHLILEKINKGEIIIGLTAHFFNWEAHLLAIMAHVQKRCEVVYLKVNNPYFERLMQQLRSRFGGMLVERKQFHRNFLRERSNPRLIVLAADQRPQQMEQRYWAAFMNREAAFFEGAEKLAKKFNHSVIFSHVTKPRRGHYIFTYELLEEPPFEGPNHSITNGFIRCTENNIRLEPSLYLWSHDRWKKSPKPKSSELLT